MSQHEKTAAVVFRVIGCCVFLFQMFGAADSIVMNVARLMNVARRSSSIAFAPGIFFDLIPFFLYAAAAVALFALSKPLARLVVRGIGYD